VTRRILAFVALLVLWGNASQRLLGDTAVLPGGSVAFIVAGLGAIALSLAFARAIGLDGPALGISRAGIIRTAALGVIVGGVIATVDVAAIRVAPLIVGAPLIYAPVMTVTRDELLRHIAIFLPLGAVIPEEIVFRGTLLGALAREWGTRLAVAGSAIAFALWHVAVVFTTVASTSLGPLGPIAVPGALVILVAGGAIMAALRVRTRSLAAPIAAHWTFNAVILVGFWTAQRA
jgi:membrane protease YdiL (CAAX protease family)